MSDKYYTLKQLSDLLITPVPYLRHLIKTHKLKACFIGRQYIVAEEDLKLFISKLGVKNEIRETNYGRIRT